MATYATDEIVAEADMNFTDSRKPAGQTAVENVQVLQPKALLFWPVYDEYGVKGTFIEGLRASIWQRVWSYWTKIKLRSLQKLARSALSIKRLLLGNVIS